MQINSSEIQVTEHVFYLTLDKKELSALQNRLNNPCTELLPIDEGYLCALKNAINTAIQATEPPQVP